MAPHSCLARRGNRNGSRRSTFDSRLFRSSSFLLPRSRSRQRFAAMFSDQIRSVHFVGICGTAMAAVAAAMKEKGFDVSGSDTNVYPPMSTFLAERKIEVMPAYSESNLAHKPDLVVIGN